MNKCICQTKQEMANATAHDAVGRHNERWETFAKAFQAQGGTVCDVTASDGDRIVAAPDSCDGLNDGDAPRSTTTYA